MQHGQGQGQAQGQGQGQPASASSAGQPLGLAAPSGFMPPPSSVGGSPVAGLSGGSVTGSASGQQQVSKRRRGLGVVTPNACNECRKKRAKVGGSV